MSGSRRKYFEGSAKVNLTMPESLADRIAKLAHERSKATGRLVSRSDVINEFVREALGREWTGGIIIIDRMLDSIKRRRDA